jgi:hypothetical protein
MAVSYNWGNNPDPRIDYEDLAPPQEEDRLNDDELDALQQQQQQAQQRRTVANPVPERRVAQPHQQRRSRVAPIQRQTEPFGELLSLLVVAATILRIKGKAFEATTLDQMQIEIVQLTARDFPVSLDLAFHEPRLVDAPVLALVETYLIPALNILEEIGTNPTASVGTQTWAANAATQVQLLLGGFCVA